MSELVRLDHGSGGRATLGLIEGLILKHLHHPALACLDDQARLEVGPLRLAFTTDGFVVDPPFFPGGDIGCLAVHGTINDLAMGGAEPIALSLALIIEEGLPMADLERVMESVARASMEAGVPVVTGDTKVVGRGAADKIFITTSGLGVIPTGVEITGSGVRPGDKMIVSGPVGDHGMAVMALREGMALEGGIMSDTAALHGLVRAMVQVDPGAIHAMRDPTRGGLATTLNELAGQSGVTIELDEEALPVRPAVRGACEILGLDPLYVACEGVLSAFVAPERAMEVLAAMRAHPRGQEAALVGEARGGASRVVLRTLTGSRRVLDMLSGAQLPRIC